MPLVDHREKSQIWKWICLGRDSDAELQPLCNKWLALMTSSVGDDAEDDRPALAGKLTMSARDTATPPPR